MSKFNLIPCPHCGGAVDFVISPMRGGSWSFGVNCDACDIEAVTHYNVDKGDIFDERSNIVFSDRIRAEAAAKWNRRDAK